MKDSLLITEIFKLFCHKLRAIVGDDLLLEFQNSQLVVLMTILLALFCLIQLEI